MTEAQLRTVKAAVDLAYSVLVVGIIVYMARAEIRKAYNVQRLEIDARRAKITRRARELRNRAGFGYSIRDTLIDEEMDAIENLDATLDAFAMIPAIGMES